LRTAVRKVFDKDYVEELKDYEAKMTEARKKHRKEYWER